MTFLPGWFLLAAAPFVLFDGEVRVGARQLRTLDIPGSDQPVRLVASWRGDGTAVRAVVLDREELRKWQDGEAHQPLAMSGHAVHGLIQTWVRGPGRYVLAIDNTLSPKGVRLRLTVKLQPGVHPMVVRYPDPGRARFVVVASGAAFLAICVYAGFRLRRALDRRPPNEI
jgi:hypothetical protein